MKKIIVILLIIFVTNSNAQTNIQIVNTELGKMVTNTQLLPNDILNWIQTDNTTSGQNDISHVYFRQSKYGLEINGTESAVHILANKSVLTSNFNFLKNLDSKIISQSQPVITPIQAVQYAATNLSYTITNTLTVVSSSLTSQNQTISNGGISTINIPVKLMYQRLPNNQVVLVWDLSIQSSQQNELYSLKVNAFSGAIEDKVNLMLTCNFSDGIHKHDETNHSESKFEKWSFKNMLKKESILSNSLLLSGTYNVFALPIESPYFGSRSLITNAENLNASPYGWHDTNGISGAEYTVTRGNNVNAYRNVGSTIVQPNGGSGLVFDYPLNLTFSTTNPSENASITNLFYYNNVIHDIMYNYGFDEASGNFQTSNYNSGFGLGNDHVNASALITQWGNATFGTLPDGVNPTMSMYYNGTQDGNLENLVIAHEYGHGISNRLTGGPSNVNCLDNREQMGEGWSDWYGLILSMEIGDNDTTSRTVGNYLFNQGANGNGIRAYPYNTLMSVNPHTYNSIKTSGRPHGLGSVWCAMLWEMTWNLIDVYGFDTNFYTGTGGNNKAMKLVTLALKLQPCSPGFVDGRNALLAADQALYGGANQCLIWDAFAKRGLGFSALQGSTNSELDGSEAYDLPAGSCSCPENLNVETSVLSPNLFTRQANLNIYATNIINSGASAIYHAGQSVVLKNGFISKNGSTFRGYIEGCTNLFQGRKSSDQFENNRIIKNYVKSNFESNYNKLTILPNPSNGIFKISLNEVSEGTIEISDLYGFNIYKSEFKNQTEFEMNLQDRPKGIYIVKVFSGDQVFTNKIIKN